MHQTTVRFSVDLWAQLENEAREAGVSAAQYVRDATLARLAYSAGQRDAADTGPPAAKAVDEARADALDAQSGASAVWAQAQLARERARLVRGRSRQLQTRSPADPATAPAPPSLPHQPAED